MNESEIIYASGYAMNRYQVFMAMHTLYDSLQTLTDARMFHPREQSCSQPLVAEPTTLASLYVVFAFVAGILGYWVAK